MKNEVLCKQVIVSLIAFGLFSQFTFAEETTKEKVKETYHTAKTKTKKAARSAEDKGCEMVNGKMQCLGKKIKHTGENVKDEVKDKMDEKK